MLLHLCSFYVRKVIHCLLLAVCIHMSIKQLNNPVINNIFNKFLEKWCSVSVRTRRSGIRTPMRERFSGPKQTGFEAHTASCTERTGSLSSGKSAGAWFWPPTPLLAPGSSMGIGIPLLIVACHILWKTRDLILVRQLLLCFSTAWPKKRTLATLYITCAQLTPA